MVAVTYQNLFSESRNNVVTIITSNVSDPIISSAEFRKWIYSREPDVKSSDFKGYPFIIIHPSEFEPEDGGSLDGKSKFVFWTIEIEIVTSDRGYGSEDGKGLTHMDSISNSVIQQLLSITNRNTLSGANLKFSRPVPTSVVTEPIGEELTYRRSIIQTFKNRIQVSA